MKKLFLFDDTKYNQRFFKEKQLKNN
jgi:hypothetical protein